MRYVERDKKACRAAFLGTFTASIILMAVLLPYIQIRQAAFLAGVSAALVAMILGAYQDYLNHLADELAARRSEKIAVLAMDD